MSKKNTTSAVAEAEKLVADLTDSIAEKVVARDAINDELRSLRAAKSAAESAVTTARAVALIDLASDPTRFAAEAEKLRLAIAESDAGKTSKTVDRTSEFDGHDDRESTYVGSGLGHDGGDR